MEILTNVSILKKLITLIILVLPIIASAGGGWPKKKGTGYYKISQWWVVSDQHFTSTGMTDPNIRTGIFNTSFYGEYGINDRVTGIVYFPFFSRVHRGNEVSGTNGSIISKEEAVNSIGDTNLGIKYGISKPGSKFAFAGSLILGLPLGENAGGSDGSLQTGDGEFNQMIQFDLSKSFSLGNLPMYASIYAAFNNRTNDFSDEFRVGAETGVSFFDNKLWTIGRLDIVESFQNGLTSSEGSEGASVFANNTEYASFTIEGAYYFSQKFGVSAAYGGAFSGSLIFANPSYSVGVFLDIK
jgi:protein XagA